MEISKELLKITEQIGKLKTLKEMEDFERGLPFLFANNSMIERLIVKRIVGKWGAGDR